MGSVADPKGTHEFPKVLLTFM